MIYLFFTKAPSYFLKILFNFLIIFLFGSSFFNLWQLFQNNIPPGNLIKINFDSNPSTYHIYCVGKGNPTIIFDSDWNLGYYAWGLIQGITSQFTRTCSFDRMGYGFSPLSDKGYCAKNVVRDLHQVLISGF